MQEGQYHIISVGQIYKIMKNKMVKEILKGLKPQLKMGKLTQQFLSELNDERNNRFNQLRKSLTNLTQ